MSIIITIFILLVIDIETGVHRIYDSMKGSKVGCLNFFI